MNDGTFVHWLPVDGYPNYEVSDLGQIWSRPRNGTRGGILKQVWQAGKYLVVSLHRDGKYTTYRVHTLVAEAFIGSCPGPGYQVRHLDGRPACNAAFNLIWGTAGENAQDRAGHGRTANTNKTHCKYGHEYTAANTHVTKNGWRRCRMCDNISHAARRLGTMKSETDMS